MQALTTRKQCFVQENIPVASDMHSAHDIPATTYETTPLVDKVQLSRPLVAVYSSTHYDTKPIPPIQLTGASGVSHSTRPYTQDWSATTFLPVIGLIGLETGLSAAPCFFNVPIDRATAPADVEPSKGLEVG